MSNSCSKIILDSNVKFYKRINVKKQLNGNDPIVLIYWQRSQDAG